MSRFEYADRRDGTGIDGLGMAPADGAGPERIAPEGLVGGPRVLVHPIERTVVVRFANAGVLFGEDAVRG